METVRSLLESVRSFDVTLFTVGKTQITLWSVLTIIISVSVLFIVAGWTASPWSCRTAS